MIISRIRRGASRTNLLVKRNLSALSHIRSTAAWVRSSRSRVAAVALFAVRMVMAPVPVAQAAIPGGATDTDQPPSTVAVVSFAPTAANPLQTNQSTLQSVQVGQSRADQAEAAALAAQAQASADAAARARSVAYAAAQRAAAQVAAEAVQTAPVDKNDTYNELYQRGLADMGEDETEAMLWIGERESGVNLNSRNATSGACGIWQALPCSKMGGMDIDHQYSWVKRYAYARYGSFVNAKEFWLRNHNW